MIFKLKHQGLSFNLPKNSSITGDMRKEVVTREAARRIIVMVPPVMIARAVLFSFTELVSGELVTDLVTGRRAELEVATL